MASPSQSPSGRTSVGWPGISPEFSTSFPIATSAKTDDNDEDEWEYEYSTTETETYYVTLDLSHSGMFEKVKDNFHAGNRGGYKQWFNPVYADPNKNTRLRPTKTTAMVFGDEKDDADDEDFVPEEEEDEPENEPRVDRSATYQKGPGRGQDDATENDIPIDPALRSDREDTRPASQHLSRAASRAPSVMPQGHEEPKKPARIRNVGEIQILDLHSDNPIVSYKGRIFSGSWASNIGTELIFGAHDEVAERELPYLKSLPGGVDLMAASSCRILTIPADLRPKHRTAEQKPALMLPYANRRPAPDKYRQMRKETKIEIPIAWDKHGRRKPQARFLENLMAIKAKRGEHDEVTTMTRDTRRDYVDRDEDPEEATAQKKRARDRRRQKRLAEERAAKPKKKRTGGNRWLRKRIVTFGDRAQSTADEKAGGASVLTPKTWRELGDAAPGGETATTRATGGEATVMQSA
ncbi:unnamed protein product [Discula destructiva]